MLWPVSDALRSELIFLPGPGRAGSNCYRVDDCIVIRTPDNPTYWWGNTLYGLFRTNDIPGDRPRRPGAP